MSFNDIGTSKVITSSSVRSNPAEMTSSSDKDPVSQLRTLISNFQVGIFSTAQQNNCFE
jgi:hypothetical protein